MPTCDLAISIARVRVMCGACRINLSRGVAGLNISDLFFYLDAHTSCAVRYQIADRHYSSARLSLFFDSLNFFFSSTFLCVFCITLG